MSYYANNLPVLGLATRSASGSSVGWNIGEYVEGLLVIRVTGLGGTNGRITPRWQISPNGSHGSTAGNYLTLRTFATSIRATGISMMTLNFLGRYGRVAYAIAGTAGAVKFEVWLIGKGVH